MAPLSFSPEASISSHTLSAGSAQMDLTSTSNSANLANLLRTPYLFLSPTTQLQASCVSTTKGLLDPIASGISEIQKQRKESLRKRKRDYDLPVLRLKKINVDGFGTSAIFEQARKVIEAATDEIELALPEDDEQPAIAEDEGSEAETGSINEEDLSDPLGHMEYDSADVYEDDEGEPIELEEDDEDEEGDLDVDGIDEAEDIEDDEEQDSDDEPTEEYRPDPNGLNDGFFSIDDFNRVSEFLEQQDQRGEPPASDDEEINLDADPFSVGIDTAKADDEESASEDSSEEGGPTFGNVDLNAPEGDSEDEEIDEGDMDGLNDVTNANNIMYADFFRPPAQKASRKKKGKPHPHNFPAAVANQDDESGDEDEVENTMARVQRDLFEESDQSDGDLSEVDPSDPKSRKSNHERRQAKIQEEIRRLEAANVAKRQWQLQGEVTSRQRPENALLEEDLEFETIGKPVPVITAEVSESIEELIKRRILAGEFDELHRRRPDNLAGPAVRRGKLELDDTKSSKGLGELYEEDILRQTDPNFVDARDEKLKKEHAEIEALWKNVCGKLDSLSSWHYKPKPAAPNLEIRVDAAAIEMEDARPTAGGDVSGASMLAPQEIYKPGDDKEKAEIVTKGGMPVAREELTREQKMRRRRREKERIKKASSNTKPGDKNKKKEQNKELLGTLKKGGVQVIGKKGQLTDVEGKEVKEKARAGVGNFKL